MFLILQLATHNACSVVSYYMYGSPAAFSSRKSSVVSYPAVICNRPDKYTHTLTGGQVVSPCYALVSASNTRSHTHVGPCVFNDSNWPSSTAIFRSYTCTRRAKHSPKPRRIDEAVSQVDQLSGDGGFLAPTLSIRIALVSSLPHACTNSHCSTLATDYNTAALALARTLSHD